MDIGAAGSVSWPVVGAALAGGRVLVLAAPGVTSAYYSPGDQALTLLGGLRLVDGVTVVDDPQLAKPAPGRWPSRLTTRPPPTACRCSAPGPAEPPTGQTEAVGRAGPALGWRHGRAPDPHLHPYR